MCVCVRACVHACVRACVRVCVCFRSAKDVPCILYMYESGSSSIVHMRRVYVTDFFPSECSEDAEEECSELRAEPPLSDEFNSTAFEGFCR